MTPFNIIKALIGCGDLGRQVWFSHMIAHARKERIRENGANPKRILSESLAHPKRIRTESNVVNLCFYPIPHPSEIVSNAVSRPSRTAFSIKYPPMDGRTDGRTNEQMDARTYGCKHTMPLAAPVFMQQHRARRTTRLQPEVEKVHFPIDT